MSDERFRVRPMHEKDIPGAVALQRACFPPPFPEELLWKPEHLERHMELFPVGQLVAVNPKRRVVGSASACLISEENWNAHRSWEETVGGPFLNRHEPEGNTLFGLDISVHPEWRRYGIGRALYQARFDIVRNLGLARYGTACRLPGYSKWSAERGGAAVEAYCEAVAAGEAVDRTMTPLLRYGLRYRGVIHEHMEDEESGNAAAILEWTP